MTDILGELKHIPMPSCLMCGYTKVMLGLTAFGFTNTMNMNQSTREHIRYMTIMKKNEKIPLFPLIILTKYITQLGVGGGVGKTVGAGDGTIVGKGVGTFEIEGSNVGAGVGGEVGMPVGTDGTGVGNRDGGIVGDGDGNGTDGRELGVIGDALGK
jgi:hypothetical protein